MMQGYHSPHGSASPKNNPSAALPMPAALPWLPLRRMWESNTAHLLAYRPGWPHRPHTHQLVWFPCSVPAMLQPYTPRRNRRAARLSVAHNVNTCPRCPPSLRLRNNSPYGTRCQIETQTLKKTKNSPFLGGTLSLCKKGHQNSLLEKLYMQ